VDSFIDLIQDANRLDHMSVPDFVNLTLPPSPGP
jgi:hypothetical protein